MSLGGLAAGFVRFILLLAVTWGLYLQLWFRVFEAVNGSATPRFEGLAVNAALFWLLVTLWERIGSALERRTRRSKVAALIVRVLEPFRSGALYVSMVTTAGAAYFGSLWGSGALWEYAAARAREAGVPEVPAAALTVLAALFLVGWAFERVFTMFVVRFMSSASGARMRHGTRRASRRKPPATLARRDVDAGARVDVDPSHPLLRANASARRLEWLRRWGAPAGTLIGLVAVTAVFRPTEVTSGRSTMLELLLPMLAVWGATLVVVALAGATGVVHRSPFRQVRLLLELSFGWLGIGIVGLLCIQGAAALGLAREALWRGASTVSDAIKQVVTSRHTVWGVSAFASVMVANPSLHGVEKPERDVMWAAVATVTALALYAAVLMYVDRRRTRAGRVGVDLIYLRVFGNARRTRFVTERLLRRWLGIGRVLCIAAPDVATGSVDPEDVADVLYGRLRHKFVGSQSDARGAIGDPPSEPGVEQIFCYDDTWKATLAMLLDVPHTLVLMDLRGFAENNQGCIYEITTLLDTYPMRRLVLTVDDTTDAALLDATLQQAWSRMPAGSPNRVASPGRITVCRLPSARARAARNLARLLYQVGEGALRRA